MPSAYASNGRLESFTLTLTAGLIGSLPAEEHLDLHRDNFAAYWKVRLNPNSKDEQTPFGPDAMCEQDPHKVAERGNPEGFWLGMRSACTGRSFLLTRKGYYSLGPCVAAPGDMCCVIAGAAVPFILRRVNGGAEYKLVGEAYVNGLMHGEVTDMVRRGGLHEENIVLC